MYEYKCNIIKVVDGDTVDVDIDLGVGTLVALGYAVSSFGPDLMYTFGAM